MILLLLGPRPAAVYGIMVMLSNGVKAIRQTFDPLIVPVVARMTTAERGAGLRQVHSYAVNVVTSLQLVAAWGVLFFSGELLSIAGREYSIEPGALSILLAGNLINGFFGFNGQILVGLGRSKLPLCFNIVAIAVNAAANLALIPRLGLAGAAIGTNIAYLVQCGLMWYAQRRLTGVQVYERHLVANGALIVLFGSSVFALQDRVLACSVVERSLGFAAVLAVMGILFFFKRDTFSARTA